MEEEKKCCGEENDVLATYVGENWQYRNARLMYIAGKQDARPGTVGTLVSPQQAEGIVIDSGIPDVKSFSFTWKGQLRQLLVKINSKGGNPSSCTVRLVKPRAKGTWKSLSGDVVIGVQNGQVFTPLLFNPRALAQWGDLIFLIDYESQSIVILGADELEGMAGNYTPIKTPFSLESFLAEENAKGQAIVILGNKLYALYLVTNAGATQHWPGILCSLDIGSDGNLTIGTRTSVGMNPQAIIPVSDDTNIQLLIPAIGGRQDEMGVTNGLDSNISCVPVIGVWPVTAKVLITGDAAKSGGSKSKAVVPTVYDIHAVAAGTRGRSNMLYVLTQSYSEDDDGDQVAYWRLYMITVGQFLDYGQLSTPPTLSSAAGLEAIDEGSVTSIIPGGVYFWDLLYAQTDEVSDAGDLLWVALGTPILVTRAAKGGYGAPDASTEDDEVENAYVMFGFNGGNNVNHIDLTIEAVNQAKRGGCSLKRSLYGSVIPDSSSEK
jgi:hypothetical protein